MEQEQVKHFESGSIHVHVIPTKTFKTNTFTVQLNAPLKAETATKRALLPNILESATAEYSTRQKLRGELENLYGASLTTDVTKKGERHIITFKMDIANEKFLKDQSPLLERGLKLLSSVLFNPKQSDGAFDPKITEEEIRSHKQQIASVYDDKMRYANKRLTEEMCSEEPFGIHVLGNKEDLDDLTPGDLYAYYEKMMKEDTIDLYVLGDVVSEDVEQLVKTYFPSEGENKSGKIEPVEQSPPPAGKNEPDEVVDEQNVQQGKLHIGYRTNVVYGDDDYFALQLFNGIFGGFSHSKLFINVREKASLAYYAASRLESFKGLLIVMSGIQSSDYGKASDIIFKQMEDMKNGKFSEEDLEQTKAVYKNQILETMDMPRGRIELEYHNRMTDRPVPLNGWLDKIEAVTREAVIDVAQKVKLDTVYFLKGKEEQKHE